MTIGIVAKITIQEGKSEEAIAAFQPLLAAVEDEAGTVRYILHTDPANPELLWFYEQYADQAALDAHGTSDTMKAVGMSLRTIAAGRPEITILNVVGGKNV